MTIWPSYRRSALSGMILPLVAALALAGCASSRTGGQQAITTHGDVSVTGSVTGLSDERLAAAVDGWGARYDANPKDRTSMLNYAAALRLSGRVDQAVAVLEKGVVAYPNDPEIASSYGKALASNGDFEQALRVIRQTQQPDRPDWKLYSAEGAILDQVGQTAAARDAYQKALQIAPGEPSILNNLALSHLLGGELQPAEKLLRQAVATPGATSRIRQNLALVLGLEGRFKEAEEIASQELDPGQAAANLAYIRSMLTQPNTWQQAKKS